MAEKFSLFEHSKVLRRMSPEDARRFLDSMDLGDFDRDKLLQLAGRDLGKIQVPGSPVPPPAPVFYYDPERRYFLAAAYLAGASYAKLAQVCGVTSQSIEKSIRRVLRTAAERNARLPVQPPGLDKIIRWKEWYYSTLPPERMTEYVRVAAKMIQVTMEDE